MTNDNLQANSILDKYHLKEELVTWHWYLITVAEELWMKIIFKTLQYFPIVTLWIFSKILKMNSIEELICETEIGCLSWFQGMIYIEHLLLPQCMEHKPLTVLHKISFPQLIEAVWRIHASVN